MKKRDTTRLIMNKAKELFFKHGPKNVSMDDLAGLSGISKKTIYKNFDNKNLLIDAVVDDLIQSHKQLLETSLSTAKDAIDEILKQDAGLSTLCSGIRPSFFIELEDFFPTVWKRLERYKVNIHKSIIDNLARGKREGLYINDIDIKLISDLRMHQMTNVFIPGVLTSHHISTNQLESEFTLLYLRAITTDKGRKQLGKYSK